MDSPALASSQVSEVSEVYNAVTFLLQKLQSLPPRVSGTLDVNLTTQDGRNILSLKAEVGGPKAQDDAARSPATTFHRFRELPTEIQVMIWKLALQTPRIFRLGSASVDMQGDFPIRWLPILNPHKPPACAQVCREPRAIFKTQAKQLFGLNEGIYKSLWFSPPTDIVYWDTEIFPPSSMDYFGPTFPDVQNLAVDLPDDAFNIDLDPLLEDASSTFPGCKRLIVVMVHQPFPNGDVSFTKVKDDDEMNIPFLGGRCQWGQVRQKLSKRFPRRCKQEKPSIEGVEATAVRKRGSTTY